MVRQTIAAGVPEHVDAGPERWEVTVFEDDSANALALPGGKIGVHTGLLGVAENANQLAAVLAHAIAHVTQEHGNERMSQALLAKGGLAVAGTALGGEGPSRDLALAALSVGAKYGVLMPFSRTQESEADVVGLRYMARAGFDPRAAVELWKNMQSTGSGGGQPEFASTHPSDESRIDDLQANMSSVLDTCQTARADGEAPNCEASSTWARR